MTTFKVLTGLVDELIDPALPKSSVEGSPLQGLNGWLAAALAAESDDADLTKRGPVTRWIGYVFGDPRMTKAQAQATLPVEPGEPNPLFQICDAIIREGGSIRVGDSPLAMATVENVDRKEWQKVGYAQALVLTGGDVLDMLVYFEIDDITAEVPATFPNRNYTQLSDPEDPESGIEVIHTWETWGANEGDSAGDLPVQIGDKWYRTSRDRNNGGDYIPASAWVPASLAGLVVLESLPEAE